MYRKTVRDKYLPGMRRKGRCLVKDILVQAVQSSAVRGRMPCLRGKWAVSDDGYSSGVPGRTIVNRDCNGEAVLLCQ